MDSMSETKETNKMKLRKRIAIGVVGAMMVLTAFAGTAQATASVEIGPSVSTTAIEPRKDVIVSKYRYYNGKVQYRRWNETYGYWVDPYWIDL